MDNMPAFIIHHKDHMKGSFCISAILPLKMLLLLYNDASWRKGILQSDIAFHVLQAVLQCCCNSLPILVVTVLIVGEEFQKGIVALLVI